MASKDDVRVLEKAMILRAITDQIRSLNLASDVRQ
jgi:hypothetical protein